MDEPEQELLMEQKDTVMDTVNALELREEQRWPVEVRKTKRYVESKGSKNMYKKNIRLTNRIMIKNDVITNKNKKLLK